MKEICTSWSDCTTEIIKEAAKCKNWSSDMLYGIHDVMKCVELGEKEIPDKWFAFRELGVDHAAHIMYKWNNKLYADEQYRKIYVLRTEYEEGQYYFTLYEPEYADLCALKEEEEKNQ